MPGVVTYDALLAFRRGFVGYNPPCVAVATTIHLQEEECMGAMKEFAGVYYREGALDPKTTQLVALAAMAAAGCTS